VPWRVAMSEGPVSVRLLPSEHFACRDRVVDVVVIEHDVVYAVLHLRLTLVRENGHDPTAFETCLSYGGPGAPKLVPTDETAEFFVELRRTHHFRRGVDGRRLNGASLLSAPLRQLHPFAA